MTNLSSQLYEALADLLEYPDRRWTGRLELTRKIIVEENVDVAIHFLKFYREILPFSLLELEELYTRTFDLNPVCTLEVGYHLFGENYKRGELLAALRRVESPYPIGQDAQLPDYLPVLLRLIVRLNEDELRTSLIGECLLPALSKMKAALVEGANPYAHLVEAVREALKLEAPESESKPLPEGWERAEHYAEKSRECGVQRVQRVERFPTP